MELNILWKYQWVDPQVKTVFCWYGLFKYKHFLFVNFAWVVASNKIYFSLCHFLCHIVTSSGRIKSGVRRKEQNCGNLLQTGTDWWVDRLSLWRSRKFLTYLYEIVDKEETIFTFLFSGLQALQMSQKHFIWKLCSVSRTLGRLLWSWDT